MLPAQASSATTNMADRPETSPHVEAAASVAAPPAMVEHLAVVEHPVVEEPLVVVERPVMVDTAVDQLSQVFQPQEKFLWREVTCLN